MYKYKITTTIMSLTFRGKQYSVSDGKLKNVVYNSNCISRSYSKYCNYYIGRVEKQVRMKMRKIDLARDIETSQETKGNEESKKTRLKDVMSEVCKIQYNIIRMTRTLFLTVNRCLKTIGICASCSDCCSNPHNVKVKYENRYFSVLLTNHNSSLIRLMRLLIKVLKGKSSVGLIAITVLVLLKVTMKNKYNISDFVLKRLRIHKK